MVLNAFNAFKACMLLQKKQMPACLWKINKTLENEESMYGKQICFCVEYENKE